MNRDVYCALIVIGLLPVIAAALTRGPFGSGATLCALMVGAGLVGLVVDRPSLRVPRARLRR